MEVYPIVLLAFAIMYMETVSTFVVQTPSLSHAALSQIWASASKPPASQLVIFLLFPSPADQIPALNTVGIHISAHETAVTSSECWGGL